MKVYVVSIGWDYDGMEISEIFPTRSKAIQCAKEYDLDGVDEIEVSEWTVSQDASGSGKVIFKRR